MTFLKIFKPKVGMIEVRYEILESHLGGHWGNALDFDMATLEIAEKQLLTFVDSTDSRGRKSNYIIVQKIINIASITLKRVDQLKLEEKNRKRKINDIGDKS